MARVIGRKGGRSLLGKFGGLSLKFVTVLWVGLLRSTRLLAQAGWTSVPLLWRGLRKSLAGASVVLRWIAVHPTRSADMVVGVAMIGAIAAVLTPPAPTELHSTLDCLALNIYHEARGEPLKGKLAVGQVVMNRVAHPRFPDEVCAVITDGGEWPRGHCQFSWWCDGRSDRPSNPAAWSESRTLAREILLGAHGDPTEGALWYHATTVSPIWRHDFIEGPQIGRHIFYRPKRRPK
jgi:hypothetical protein